MSNGSSDGVCYTFTFEEDSMLSSTEAIISSGPMRSGACCYLFNFVRSSL